MPTPKQMEKLAAEAVRKQATPAAAPEEPLPPEHPFWGMANVVVTPHVAGPSDPAEIAPIFNDNIRRFLEGKALKGRVDLQRGY